MSLARTAVEGLWDLSPLPAPVMAAAKLHLLDAIGVGLAASTTKAGAAYARYAQSLPEGPASLLGKGQRVAAREAALVNGGLIHSLEYDDTHTGSIVHGSAVLASVALAASQQSGGSGHGLISAYVGWYEFLIRLGLSAAGGFQARGYQVTSVGGTLAAAGLAAQIKGLDRQARVNAIGIALSQASGVFEFLTDGSTVKSLHPGWAAQAGLTAADLAYAGLTGPQTAIEGRFGLFRVFAGDEQAGARFEQELSSLGRTWHLLDAAYKFHPCCHYIHPFLEAAEILRKDGVGPQEVGELILSVPEGAAALVCEPWEEKLVAQGHLARWSLPVTVAMQLVEGRVDLESFERPVSADVAATAALCRWRVKDDSRFPRQFDAEITCVFKDGGQRSVAINDVFGNGSRAPDRKAVEDKFRNNSMRVLPAERIEAVKAAIDALDVADDLGELTQALSVAG